MVNLFKFFTNLSSLIALSILLLFISCEECENITEPYLPVEYSIEGKWTYEANNLNTMYIYEDGIRYTFYCVGSNCDSLYNTFEAGDTNAIPGTNEYTFLNDTLTVDLNFGNELVTPITFECDGDKVNFITPGYSLYKLGSNCN